MNGYTDRAGIDARANSALLSIEQIIADHTIPAAVRLVRVAQRMVQEPILTDQSPAAHAVRDQASRTWIPVQEVFGDAGEQS